MDMSYHPMICVLHLKIRKVQFLLDAVCRYLPSPLVERVLLGVNPDY